MKCNKMGVVGVLVLILLLFSACSTSVDKDLERNEQIKESQTYSGGTKSSSSASAKSTTKYCEASGCVKSGTKKYSGISGKTEYYCNEHYNEIMNMMGKMESDVAKSSYSKNTCEVCSKEGTYSIKGISGQREYYCSKHYYEMKDLLESLLN